MNYRIFPDWQKDSILKWMMVVICQTLANEQHVMNGHDRERGHEDGNERRGDDVESRNGEALKGEGRSTVGTVMEMTAEGGRSTSNDDRVDCCYAMPDYYPVLQPL